MTDFFPSINLLEISCITKLSQAIAGIDIWDLSKSRLDIKIERKEFNISRDKMFMS